MATASGRRARAVLSAVALLGLGRAAPAATPSRWEVTVAVRISGGTGAPMSVRLALPADSETQQVSNIEITARGLEARVVRDGPDPYVQLSGKLKGSRRVAVRYTVDRRRRLAAMPVVRPLPAPAPELVAFMSPSPVFQSRSILVRDFLETNVGPQLDGTANADLLRTILQVTRDRLLWDSRGRSLTLDVIRSGKGNRIGIERAFTTFLRCAGIPARLVEGVDLTSRTRRKRVFWTEVWADDRWWPVSASHGWMGREPKTYLAVTRDGQRLLTVQGPVRATYSIQAVPEETTT
jgi:hypothetical protein